MGGLLHLFEQATAKARKISDSSPSPAAGGRPASEARGSTSQRDAAEEGDIHHAGRRFRARRFRTDR